MIDFYFTLVLSVLNIVVPWLITRWDRQRLTTRELARGWNTASWASAVYFFGPLCLPAHFWVTRRSAWGFVQGSAWMAAMFGGEWLLGLALDRALGP